MGHDDRVWAVAIGSKDITAQHHAVAHHDGTVPVDSHPVFDFSPRRVRIGVGHYFLRLKG